ncbi:MAG: DUF1279 domain-containing protein [Proteobacteria bacterium]|nr:DUF1279 domain-containing protein [Pseudomonadota bacterium]
MASLRQRYESMVSQYGGVAITLWFSLFFTTWFVCWLGLKGGLWPEAWLPAAGEEPTGLLSGFVSGMGPQVIVAYLMTQLTKPVRFILVLAGTPKIAQLLGREPAPIEAVDDVAEPAEQPGV